MSTRANFGPRIILNFSKDKHEPKFPNLKTIVNKICYLTLVSWLVDSTKKKFAKVRKSINQSVDYTNVKAIVMQDVVSYIWPNVTLKLH